MAIITSLILKANQPKQPSAPKPKAPPKPKANKPAAAKKHTTPKPAGRRYGTMLGSVINPGGKLSHKGEPCKPGWSPRNTGCKPRRESEHEEGGRHATHLTKINEEVDKLKSIIESSKPLSEEEAKELGSRIAGYTSDRIKMIRSRLGLKVSGKKQVLIDNLVNHALGRTIGPSPTPPSPTPPPTPKPEDDEEKRQKEEDQKRKEEERKRAEEGAKRKEEGEERERMAKKQKQDKKKAKTKVNIEDWRYSNTIGEKIASDKEAHDLVTKLANMKLISDDASRQLEEISTKVTTLQNQYWDARDRKENDKVRTLGLELQQAIKERDELSKAHNDAKPQALIKILGLPEKKRMKISARPVKGYQMPSKSQISKFNTGLEWLKNLVGARKDQDEIPEIKVINDTSRAYFRWGYGNNELNMGNGDKAVAAHELGHAIERNVLGVYSACSAFLDYRRKGEPYKRLNEVAHKGYRDEEMGVKDDFTKVFGKSSAYYVGKYYSDATEILSMGIEQLYRSPIEFAQKDPEYCAFVIRMLRGDYV